MKLRISLILWTLIALFLPAKPEDALSYFQKGQELYNNEDYYGAIEAYQEALSLNSHYLDALLQLSLSYFRIEEYQEAQRFIEEAQQYGRNNLNLLNMEGRILVGKNELSLAEEKFRQVIAREPNNLDANLGLAEVLLLQGNTQEGAIAFRRSLILSPESKRALLSMMLLFDSRGEYEKADIYLDLALKYHAGDAQVFIQAAYHYLKAGELEKALYYGENAAQMNEDISGPDYLLATIYYQKKDYQQASETLQRELRRNPTDLQSLFLLAQTLEKMNRLSEASILYQRILRESSTDETARLHYEALLKRMGDSAADEIAAAAEYHYLKGKEFEENFRFPEALLEYRRARWMEPYHYESWESYSRIMDSLGYPEKSLDILRAMKDSGYSTEGFLENLEMREHSHEKSLADRWNIDQFQLPSNPYNLSLFYTENTQNFHYGADAQYADFFRYHLIKNEFVNLETQNQRISGFSEAFSKAREQGSDYFFIIENSEQERSFFVRISMFLTRTGRMIDQFSLIRMGNARIQVAMSEIAERVTESFLPRGRMVVIKENKGIINLGSIQGIEKDQIFRVFKKNTITLLSEFPWIEFNDSDYLGQLTITETDEEMAVGYWENNGPFTLVAEDDEAYLQPESDEDNEENTSSGINWVVDQDLKNQLLMLQ